MHASMHAKDLPGLRARLLRHLDEPTTRMMWEMILLRGQFYLGHLPDDIRPDEVVGRLVGDERHRLRQAELFFVSEEMTDLARGAGALLPEFRFSPDDLPAEYGFLVWNGVAGHREENGLPIDLVAVSWGPTPVARAVTEGRLVQGPGVWLSFWSDPRTAEDVIFSGSPVPADPEDRWRARRIIGPLTYEREVLVPFLPEGDGWGDFLQGIDGADEAIRTLLATFLLMGQTVTSTERVAAAPRERRSLQRAGMPAAPVRYVALRRAPHGRREDDARPEPGGAGRYRHQFPVSGHWRRQWYPSQSRHRPLWIDPFWKGPEGAPLLHAERVFTVRR